MQIWTDAARQVSRTSPAASASVPRAATDDATDDASCTLLALCIGAAITLCVYGYQFGRSNHTVYLLDALHRSDPTLLANDWFTTQTFQYHAVFGWVTRGLMHVGLLAPGFLVGYLVLVVLFHVAWMRIVRALGGSPKAYLASVLLYYLSAGGTGLGVYQFFQDSSFLPSNVANVAMLWGVCLWITGRPIASGAWFGVAGMFHLNHAIAGVACWCALVALDRFGPISLRGRREVTGCPRRAPPGNQPLTPASSQGERGRDGLLLGTLLALAPSLVNIAFAFVLSLRHRGQPMPLDEFVALFVRLRHPHHYEPRFWPAALWVAFLWPLPLAGLAFRATWRRQDLRPAVARTVHVLVIFSAMLAVALVGAGLCYVSETLIQMSLYRFSIYVHLLACVGAAIYLLDAPRLTGARPGFTTAAMLLVATVGPLVLWLGPRLGLLSVGGIGTFVNAKRGSLVLFCVLGIAPAAYGLIAHLRRPRVRIAVNSVMIAALVATLVLGWNRWIGLTVLSDRTDSSYVSLCRWAREHTPRDAVFLVPPQESEFRYHAQRAIVVNFKGVPQFSSELGAWRDRLRDVLGLDDLTTLPSGFDRVGQAMGELYDGRSADAMVAVAEKYGARYVVATHALAPDAPSSGKLVTVIDDRFFLYDLSR